MPLRPTARRAALRIAPRLALAVSIAAVTSFASMVMPVQAHVRILDRDTDRGGDSDRRDDRDRDDRDRDDRRDDRDRRIIKIKPAIGRPGDLVTITGDDIGEFHVRITLGGISANIVSVAENRVTFVVPAGVPAGAETVVVTTPRGRHGSITFQVLEGVLLTGKAKAPASSALVNIPPVPVDGTQIENGVIMTRLSVRLTPDSTVAQVNAALISVNGGIVTMAPGTLSIAVGIPRPSTLANLESLVATLNRQPGIRLASLALEVSSKLFLSPLDFVAARSLFPSRFPAAWNALALVVATDAHGSVVCTRPKVPVLIADFFGSVPPGFSGQVPFFQSAAPARRILSADDAGHGYLVALAGVSRVGANPFGECLDVRLIQSAGFFPDQDIVSIQSHMPAAPTKFIVNYSMGFADSCGGSASGQPCQPPSDRMPGATTRAFHATTWKEMTAARWPDFLMVVAAGNEGLEESTTIYPAMGDARFGSPMAIAAFHDPTLGFVDDVHLWDPPPAFAANGFLSLAGDAAQVASDLHARGLDTPASVAPNVVVVGSANNMLASNAVSKRVTPEQLVQSGFSDRNSDVLAVGEEPFGVSGLKGTSFSAPQVTGLASYLWLLSPDLRALPPAITRQAILQNARNGVIDAYATALSLDGAVSPATALVRNAILDVNNDSAFTESDIDEYLRHLYAVDANGVITNQAPASTTADFSRYDLNGDGFTTSGSRREPFDLDRVGSTQFGQTKYSTVTQDIEGQPVTFDETGLTDIEILCYYAYSPLYQGNPDARKTFLRGRCGIGITPEQVTLRSGQTQLFAASEPALFTATSGSINATTGLFTAGPSGAVTVRATSIANPNLFAEATVTVTSGLVFAGTVGYTEEYHYATMSGGFPQTRDSSVKTSVDVRVEMHADGTFGPVRGVGTYFGKSTAVDACHDFTKPPNPDPQSSANSTRKLTNIETDTIDVHAGTLKIDQLVSAILSGEDGGMTHTVQEFDDNGGGDGCNVGVITADEPGVAFLFYGRPIYDNGQLIAIDFNVDYSQEFTVAFQTGRLERQP